MIYSRSCWSGWLVMILSTLCWKSRLLEKHNQEYFTSRIPSKFPCLMRPNCQLVTPNVLSIQRNYMNWKNSQNDNHHNHHIHFTKKQLTSHSPWKSMVGRCRLPCWNSPFFTGHVRFPGGSIHVNTFYYILRVHDLFFCLDDFIYTPWNKPANSHETALENTPGQRTQKETSSSTQPQEVSGATNSWDAKKLFPWFTRCNPAPVFNRHRTF